MQVASSQNKQPNFKAIGLIQIEKSAFRHPENTSQVYKQFDKTLGKIVQQAHGIWTGINYFRGKYNKVQVVFEQPLYYLIQYMLKKIKKKPLNDASRQIIEEIKKPLHDRYHSFYVYTKEHADLYRSVCDPKNPTAISSFINSNDKNINNKDLGIYQRLLSAYIRANEFLVNRLEQKRQGEPIKLYRLKSLSELPAVMQELGY